MTLIKILGVNNYFFSLISILLVLILSLIVSILCEKAPSGCGQTSCPHYTRPVCATNGKTRRTFINQCAVRVFNECSHEESE